MAEKGLSSYNRMRAVLYGESIDRIPVAEDFWWDTIEKWTRDGHILPGESMVEHFDLDADRNGLINSYIEPNFQSVLLEEDEDKVLYLDGNGATLRHHKKHSSTPEHVGYKIIDRDTWETFAKPALASLDRCRIPFLAYRDLRKKMKEQERFFMNDAFGPFEMMQRLVGHEVLLLNMALDPEWVKDMVITYAQFNIIHWEELFSEEGLPDSTWIADDLGFKDKPFMSPDMFEDMMLPGYEIMINYLHSKGLKVVLHSCGYIQPLLPLLIDIGIDCYEAIEYKAGTDMRKLFTSYGNKIVYFGNIDTRVLESNDIELIKKELNDKIKPIIQNNGRYILHSDHSISPKVEYKTFCRYLEIGRDLLNSNFK